MTAYLKERGYRKIRNDSSNTATSNSSQRERPSPDKGVGDAQIDMMSLRSKVLGWHKARHRMK
eukprot:6266755-Amphidinium_carterae.1